MLRNEPVVVRTEAVISAPEPIVPPLVSHGYYTTERIPSPEIPQEIESIEYDDEQITMENAGYSDIAPPSPQPAVKKKAPVSSNASTKSSSRRSWSSRFRGRSSGGACKT